MKSGVGREAERGYTVFDQNSDISLVRAAFGKNVILTCGKILEGRILLIFGVLYTWNLTPAQHFLS
jgi:hypothetical protein